jgi:hypothetical protein
MHTGPNLNQQPGPTDPHDLLPERFQPLALLMAWLVPGLGHYYLGARRRARRIALGVFGLFLSGLLIGGIDSVDSTLFYKRLLGQQNPPERVDGDMVWFLGAMFAGPAAFAVDLAHQYRFKVVEDVLTGQQALRVRRSAMPYEIRDPRTGKPIQVRDRDTGAPINFTDPLTGQTRLATPADRPPSVQALGRVREIGTLLCTLAGMLNLIAIVDAAWSRRRTSDPDARRRTPAAAGGAS